MVPIRLQGVTHGITVDVTTDAPLHLAVGAFAAAAGVAGIAPIAPTELLVKDGEILDQQTTSARSLFYGASSTTPETLQAVYQDKAKMKAALKAKHRKVPEGYAPFTGLA